MKSREELDAKLREILSAHDITTKDGHVYFQAPSSHSILYPAIIYKFVRELPIYADNIVYSSWDIYELNIVTREPNIELAKAVLSAVKGTIQATYSANGLHHYIGTVNW